MSDSWKAAAAWALCVGLVGACFGLLGAVNGRGFLAATGRALGAVAVACGFIAAFAAIGELLDRRLGLDGILRIAGGILGLLAAALLGILLQGPPAPIPSGM